MVGALALTFSGAILATLSPDQLATLRPRRLGGPGRAKPKPPTPTTPPGPDPPQTGRDSADPGGNANATADRPSRAPDAPRTKE
jgi:hypothetical protein